MDTTISTYKTNRKYTAQEARKTKINIKYSKNNNNTDDHTTTILEWGRFCLFRTKTAKSSNFLVGEHTKEENGSYDTSDKEKHKQTNGTQ
jgi:hypothetical protein